jgi:hypothetical protein
MPTPPDDDADGVSVPLCVLLLISLFRRALRCLRTTRMLMKFDGGTAVVRSPVLYCVPRAARMLAPPDDASDTFISLRVLLLVPLPLFGTV